MTDPRERVRVVVVVRAGVNPAPTPDRAGVNPAPTPDRAGVNPAPTPTREPPAARTASPSPPPWEPPITFADRFSDLSVKAIRGSLATLGLVSLVVLVLWAIPSYQAATSDAYALAARRAERDPTLRSFVGPDLEADQLPVRYRLDPQGGRFTFVVRGSMGQAVVESLVEDGEVVRHRPQLILDWTRSLEPQLEPW